LCLHTFNASSLQLLHCDGIQIDPIASSLLSKTSTISKLKFIFIQFIPLLIFTTTQSTNLTLISDPSLPRSQILSFYYQTLNLNGFLFLLFIIVKTSPTLVNILPFSLSILNTTQCIITSSTN